MQKWIIIIEIIFKLRFTPFVTPASSRCDCWSRKLSRQLSQRCSRTSFGVSQIALEWCFDHMILQVIIEIRDTIYCTIFYILSRTIYLQHFCSIHYSFDLFTDLKFNCVFIWIVFIKVLKSCLLVQKNFENSFINLWRLLIHMNNETIYYISAIFFCLKNIY
jgi:hypothetical protein